MELLMKDNELLDLGEKMSGVRIECLDGRCWVTQAGDSRDHILGAGDTFSVRANGRVIITATKSCRLMLKKTAAFGRYTNLCKTINGVLRGCAAGI